MFSFRPALENSDQVTYFSTRFTRYGYVRARVRSCAWVCVHVQARVKGDIFLIFSFLSFFFFYTCFLYILFSCLLLSVVARDNRSHRTLVIINENSPAKRGAGAAGSRVYLDSI